MTNIVADLFKGMAEWIVNWKDDQQSLGERLRRKDKIILELIEENSKLSDEVDRLRIENEKLRASI
jgi:hypothetical protein